MIIDEGRRSSSLEEFKRNLRSVLLLGDEDQSVNNIAINGDVVWVHRGSQREKLPLNAFEAFDGSRLAPWHVQGAAKNAAVYSCVPFGHENPLLTVAMPPHYRVSVTMPPAGRRWCIDIRFLPRASIPLESYVESGIMSASQLSEIRDIVRMRNNVVLSGTVDTGKTTLLRAMLSEIQDDRIIVTIEDAAELNLPGDNVIAMYTAPGVYMADLLRQALRHKHDRIIIGECRGPEALELVRSWNTGSRGGMATVHSNGREETIPRLHTLIAEAQPTFPRDAILSALDVVIQIEGQGRERRISSIWEVPKPALV